MRVGFVVAVGVLSLGWRPLFGGAAVRRAEEDDPRNKKIVAVMRTGFATSKSLMRRVMAGTASEEEQRQFLELLESLRDERPPQGELAAWRERVDGITAAAKIVITDGDAESQSRLLAAAKCGDCHRRHRPVRPSSGPLGLGWLR